MTTGDIVFCAVLLSSITQWGAYFKFRKWLSEREPEPKQGNTVDKCLWHLVSNVDAPWQARKAWERKGRGYVVAVQRQGMYTMLDEYRVHDLFPAFAVGYQFRQDEDAREMESIKKQLERRGNAVEHLQEEVKRLRKNQAKQTPARAQTPQTPLEQAWRDWGSSPELTTITELMNRSGWKRIEQTEKGVTQVEAAQEAEAVMRAEAPPEVEAAMQSEAISTPDYKAMKGREKIEAMIALKDAGKTNAEIADLFDMTKGGVKGIISKNKAKTDNIVTIDFGVSEQVSEGF